MTANSLGPWDLAFGAALVVANAGLTIGLGLGLARTLVVAAIRVVVQLTLVGFVLRTIFASASPGIVLAAGLVMMAAATVEIASRQERPLAGSWRYGLGGTSLAAATTFVLTLSYLTRLRPESWYDPRVLIPLLGILLGSVMSGISIGLNSLGSSVVRERVSIEARLALGATRFQALETPIRAAIRAGLIPIVNQMAAAGLVTLPGLMTGQILAGADPQSAANNQILILFLLATATSLGVIGAVYAAAWRITDDRHRLRLDRLKTLGR